jgi:hypothetical protein
MVSAIMSKSAEVPAIERARASIQERLPEWSSMLQDLVRIPFFVEAGNIFFSYRMSLYHDIALAEAQLALREGRPAPWLT